MTLNEKKKKKEAKHSEMFHVRTPKAKLHCNI